MNVQAKHENAIYVRCATHCLNLATPTHAVFRQFETVYGQFEHVILTNSIDIKTSAATATMGSAT